MTVGDLRKAIADLPDTTAVVYAWTWGSPEKLSLGSYLGSAGHTTLIIGSTSADYDARNIVIWEETQS